MSEYELYCFNNRKNKDCSEYLMQRHKYLVYHIINQYYDNTGTLDYSDFVSSGLFGLYKAILTFDVNKGNKFSTYAGICIHNEIKIMFRRLKKHRGVVSMNTELNEDYEGNVLTYEDILYDRKVTVDYDSIIVKEALNQTKFTELEKKIIILRSENKSQQEISKILGYSQSYISRLLKRAQDKLKNNL